MIFSLLLFIILLAVGFMMGVLYKRTHTTASLLNPNPHIALKAFIWVFSLAIVITFALSYFTTKALTATEIPEENNMSYENLKSVMVFTINLSFFLLIVISNAYSQSLKKLAPMPYVLAFAFYCIFILKDAYYITDYYLMWQKTLQLIHEDLESFTKAAWTRCFAAMIVTTFNAGMVWWGLRK